MAEDIREETLEAECINKPIGDLKLEGDADSRPSSSNGDSHNVKRRSSSNGTPGASRSRTQTPIERSRTSSEEITIRGDIDVLVEPGKTPKLSKKATKKVPSRKAELFSHLEDATGEAAEVFERIPACIYGSKSMGQSVLDVLDCDCSEEYSEGLNHACGGDSDCINRLTKMECVRGDCNCGRNCQNQRFQQKQYANVSVIKTEKKGYGLRVNKDLLPDDFIYEYIGEVINEPTFRRRTIQYDAEGIKHFYFMSLTKNEFVDATKKGNLGRFCNHSCNPNCYVDKWVVGDKLRMGIFAERHIRAGEELAFNYNVDRYGADPQPCYCGELNCTGFIGGKTQTERATKLSHATIEALGIEDGGDGWDTAVAKKPRKKKIGEDDEEYVSNLQPRGLDEDGVRKVMATLMQCKEKWIAVKLLDRLQRAEDEKVRSRVIQMHGYQILRTTLTTWKEDNNIVLQIFDILYKFPRLTKNKISDSKIEDSVQSFIESEHLDISFEAKRLISEWSKLEVAYRIPRKKFDPTVQRRITDTRFDEVQPSLSPARYNQPFVAPSGPRSAAPQRPFLPRLPPPRRFVPSGPLPLPAGWFQATDQGGVAYYYSKAGTTTWTRPTIPAVQPPPPPPKLPPRAMTEAKALQDLIDSITKPETPATQTPTPASKPLEATPQPRKKSEKPVEKWRALSQEKQMKLYENTLFPHIRAVMAKFAAKLGKEDLKKFAKEIGKKLVASDFKNNRVKDPTKISHEQEKKVKKFTKDYFARAVEKKKEIEKVRAAKKAAKLTEAVQAAGPARDLITEVNGGLMKSEEDIDVLVDDEPAEASPMSSPSHALSPSRSPALALGPEDDTNKRKRSHDISPEGDQSPDSSNKRIKDEPDASSFIKEEPDTPSVGTPPAPPPPPPPPKRDLLTSPPPGRDMQNGAYENEDMDMHDYATPEEVEETEEDAALRRQEEDLMRENEEAERMELDGSLKTEEIIHEKTVLHEESRNGDAAQSAAALNNRPKTDEEEVVAENGDSIIW